MAAPFHPIIYVRGYAMTQTERNETAADPFCGFNLGSTLYRAEVDRQAKPRKFVFESPLLRLGADFGYEDVYEAGVDITDPDWRPREGRVGVPAKSVIIYRYYDAGSTWFGDGKADPIEVYARGLSALILRVKELVVAQEGIAPEDFRVCLVAHSMGGLVSRAFLQNKALGEASARAAVDKFFTYATPHNGIEVGGVNVPSWLSLNETNTFNRERMADYLDLKEVYQRYRRVDFIPESVLKSSRIFCMVGTNRDDYDTAAGLSKTFVGHGSDGLVKIENASVWGVDDQHQVTNTAATAYTCRSHSGAFGIVNSEEAYQNMVRFLFGDVRVDIWLQIDAVRLPEHLTNKTEVEALYQFELVAGPRGKRWSLTRRVAEEDSPACRTHAQLSGAELGPRLVYLSTVFLANRARVNPQRPGLAYAMDLRVKVPDYKVNKVFWPDQHFEGSYLFRDTLTIAMVPPEVSGGAWEVEHGWQAAGPGRVAEKTAVQPLESARLELRVPFETPGQPGISGSVLMIASGWND
jgi:hypothetical protein